MKSPSGVSTLSRRNVTSEPPDEHRIDRLRVAADQPGRRSVSCSCRVHVFSTRSSRSTMVRRILMRAKYLSFASTSVHGAISVLVRSTMSQTASS